MKRIEEIKLIDNNRKSVLYLIWKDPYMAAGNNTYINSVLDLLGLRNVLSQKNRYPKLNNEEIKRLNPDVILLPNEPYSFEESDVEELNEILPKCKIMMIEGEAFCWSGSRFYKSVEIFENLLNEIKL